MVSVPFQLGKWPMALSWFHLKPVPLKWLGRVDPDVNPGEVVIIDDTASLTILIQRIPNWLFAQWSISTLPVLTPISKGQCPYSPKRMGAQLAREFKHEADIVVGVPHSSLSAAMGFAEESGLPNEMGLIKNQYTQRTFIQPTQELREQGVRMKLSAVSGVVKGKRVVMIDDSIVRGTTSRRIEVIERSRGYRGPCGNQAQPGYPCFYGIDIQTRKELIAANQQLKRRTKKRRETR